MFISRDAEENHQSLSPFNAQNHNTIRVNKAAVNGSSRSWISSWIRVHSLLKTSFVRHGILVFLHLHECCCFVFVCFVCLFLSQSGTWRWSTSVILRARNPLRSWTIWWRSPTKRRYRQSITMLSASEIVFRCTVNCHGMLCHSVCGDSQCERLREKISIYVITKGKWHY